jgi:NitT/TauT family transport system substrate-binding protein
MKCDASSSVDPLIAIYDFPQHVRRDRREFVKGLSTLVGSAGLLAYDMRPAAAEPPPETSKIRLVHAPTICLAPQYVAQELLRAEGFTDVEYTTPEGTATIADEMAEGRIDIGQKTAAYVVSVLDAEVPIVVLAGVHAGCYELFGNDLDCQSRLHDEIPGGHQACAAGDP